MNHAYNPCVRLIWVTPNAEQMIAYIARVSNPSNQENPDYSKLLKYCIEHNHYSIFEQAYMCLEITTSRAISAQILRHRSFTFQEFSGRYAASTTIEPVEIRAQDKKNRQSSYTFPNAKLADYYKQAIDELNKQSMELYNEMLEDGVAKEVARFVLPLSTTTKLYMTGSVRSWMHYIDLRCGNGTQKEHQHVALKCKGIFTKEFPTIAGALWKEDCDSLDTTGVL